MSETGSGLTLDKVDFLAKPKDETIHKWPPIKCDYRNWNFSSRRGGHHECKYTNRVVNACDKDTCPKYIGNKTEALGQASGPTSESAEITRMRVNIQGMAGHVANLMDKVDNLRTELEGVKQRKGTGGSPFPMKSPHFDDYRILCPYKMSGYGTSYQYVCLIGSMALGGNKRPCSEGNCTAFLFIKNFVS